MIAKTNIKMAPNVTMIAKGCTKTALLAVMNAKKENRGKVAKP